MFPFRFVAREGEFGAIAISESYATSDNILSSIWSLTSLDSEDKVSDMISMVKSTVVKDARTLSALSPIHSSEDLEKAVSRNGTALATMELRSLEWLEENGKFFCALLPCCISSLTMTPGQCMDHIFVKESSIRQAGNGAFARYVVSNCVLLLLACFHQFDIMQQTAPAGRHNHHFESYDTCMGARDHGFQH